MLYDSECVKLWKYKVIILFSTVLHGQIKQRIVGKTPIFKF